MDNFLKDFSLRKILVKEWTEIFCNKVWIYSVLMTITLYLTIYYPIKGNGTLVKEITDLIITTDITLLGISISYMIFVTTLVFTAWSKHKLLKVQEQNITTFTQIFSPYLIIVVFSCFQLFVTLMLKYSFLMTPFHQLSFTINDKVIEFTSYDIVVFIIFFLFLHTILFMLHTLVLFIKDMTMYSKMELEGEFDQVLVEYYNNSEQIIQKLVEENEYLKQQLSTFDELREENSFQEEIYSEVTEVNSEEDLENKNHTA